MCAQHYNNQLVGNAHINYEIISNNKNDDLELIGIITIYKSSFFFWLFQSLEDLQNSLQLE